MNEQLKPPPGWPTIDDVEGPYLPRTYARPHNPYALPVQAPTPDAFMQGPDGQPIALYAHPPTAPAQPAPQQPAVPDTFRRDPWPLRIGAAAVAAPAFGWGGSMLFGAIAGATTAIGMVMGCLALAFLLRGSGGGKVNVKVNVHNTVKSRR